HDNSRRNKNNFIPVNCGAIPQNLFESEFFGYKKGAFTGAVRDKGGFLSQADGGTLFLDEIGELELNNQVKLLRALEGGGYIPVGGSSLEQPDVRIIAATNRNLQELVKDGLMREDFFYRIHIIPISLPPLRERKEDIPLLIESFMKKYNSNKKESPLPLKAQRAMYSHHWPGNVRELQNTIHRYTTLHKLDFMETPQQTETPTGELPAIEIDDTEMNYKNLLENFEKKVFLKALEQHQWHREKAAVSLGIPRRTFFRKLANLGLNKSTQVRG
ncbi:MAG TPA: sigma-54-dependent Fis family transcriptional regulator, partial [Desulfarculaceae bacterium]|nr:sigma-54-dependent Fis family transcriptional regulator [Desulfarculaceae bacterium]